MSTNKDESLKYLKLISASLAIVAIVLLTYAFSELKSVLVPFTMAFFVYIMLLPIKDFLEKKPFIPGWLSVSLTILIAVIFTLSVAGILTQSIQTMGDSLKLYENKINVLIESPALSFLPKDVLSLSPDSSKMIGVVQMVSKEIMGIAGNLTLIVIFLIFFLLGSKKQDDVPNPFLDEIKKSISDYIWIKAAVSLGTSFSAWVFFQVMDLELALTFAFLIFLFNFIPNIGSIIATLIPLPIAFLQFGIGLEFILILVVPGLIQVLIGNILEPKLMGKSLGLHPIVVLFFLIFWGIVWGPIGMFLAVPLTSIIKIICTRVSSLSFVGHVLEGDLNYILQNTHSVKNMDSQKSKA